jgi:hypothetical protein
MATITTGLDRTTNKDLFKVGSLRQIFDNTRGKAKVFYKEIVNDLKTNLLTERDLRMAGLEAASEVIEGQNAPIFSPVQDVIKEYTQRRFAIGFRMTDMFDRYNQYDLWNRWSGDCAKLQAEIKDVTVHVPWNNATATTLTAGTGFDTLAIASNTHTGLLSGSTADNYDNYLDAALSHASLRTARYYFATLKDDMGVYMGANATHLVFQPTQYFTVHEILGSTNKALEMSNTKNVYPESFGGIKPYEDPKLTATTAWFLISKDDNYDYNVFTGMEPNMIVKDAPDRTADRMALSFQDFAVGWGDARSIYIGNT